MDANLLHIFKIFIFENQRNGEMEIFHWSGYSQDDHKTKSFAEVSYVGTRAQIIGPSSSAILGQIEQLRCKVSTTEYRSVVSSSFMPCTTVLALEYLTYIVVKLNCKGNEVYPCVQKKRTGFYGKLIISNMLWWARLSMPNWR